MKRYGVKSTPFGTPSSLSLNFSLHFGNNAPKWVRNEMSEWLSLPPFGQSARNQSIFHSISWMNWIDLIAVASFPARRFLDFINSCFLAVHFINSLRVIEWKNGWAELVHVVFHSLSSFNLHCFRFLSLNFILHSHY